MATKRDEARRSAARARAQGPETETEAEAEREQEEAAKTTRESVELGPGRVMLVLFGSVALVLAGYSVTMANLFLAVILVLAAAGCYVAALVSRPGRPNHDGWREVRGQVGRNGRRV